MEIPIIGKDGKEQGKVKLPEQFSEEIRPDVITRAVLAIESNTRAPYGSDPMAGKKQSAKLSRRRRDYKASYGHGISRVPRKTLSKRGQRMIWVGAFAPGMVGGRRAHPPKSEKVWTKKINDKERKKAIRSALSSAVSEHVKILGHILPEKYPFALSNDIENISKTSELRTLLNDIGLDQELERISKPKGKSGKSKFRSSKKWKSGPLIIVSGKCNLIKAGENIPGINVVMVNELNAKIIAPSRKQGRMIMPTVGAIEKMQKEKMFN